MRRLLLRPRPRLLREVVAHCSKHRLDEGARVGALGEFLQALDDELVDASLEVGGHLRGGARRNSARVTSTTGALGHSTR